MENVKRTAWGFDPLRSHREVLSVMQNWMLPLCSDYWDERVQAIDRLSRALDAVPPSQRDGQVGLIRAAIARHVEALSDVQLTRAAFVVADDLYKAADRLSTGTPPSRRICGRVPIHSLKQCARAASSSPMS